MTNLFTSQTPSLADNSDGTPGITTATTVRFAQGGSVTGIRFYATTTVGGTYTALLWHVDTSDDSPSGTLLASKTMGGAPTGGAWNTVTFDTPVSVSTGNLYRAGIFSGAGRYVATVGFFASGLTNGDITADANNSDPILLGTLHNGTFVINATAAYPGSGGGTCYFVDVEFSVGTTPVSGSDGGSSAESVSVSVVAPLADAGAGADTQVPAITVPLSDAASGADVLAVSAVTVAAGDAGSAADVLDNGQSTPVSLTETGRAVDSVYVHRRGRPAGGADADGWSTFGAIMNINAEQLEYERTTPPTVCPNDGEPLQQTRGVLHCVFGGEIFDLSGQPRYDFQL